MVIPTLDAGPLFGRVLAAIGGQSGLDRVELIVVDSGSSDATPELAAQAGALVIQIAHEDFGHGRTRNVGAEAASGDTLLMLVQDAVLLGRDALGTLVLELRESETLAAVSARQVPRSDADLYGGFVVFAHDRVLREASGAKAGAWADELVPSGRRAAAGVDNVCAVLRRSAWEELRFADLPFAEDLDFGLRAFGRGWQVAVSRGAAVAHSHNRDAEYHFRRNVADRLHVASILGDRRYVRAGERPVEDVLAAGVPLAEEVQGALETIRGEAALADHLRAVRFVLTRRPRPSRPRGELARLAAVSGSGGASPAAVQLLRDDLVAVLGWRVLDAYARAHRSVSREEASGFVAKLAAAVLGRAVGDAARRSGAPTLQAELLRGT